MAKVCVGKTCLREPELQYVKDLVPHLTFSSATTGRMNLGDRWAFEWTNDVFYLRDRTSTGDKRFAFFPNSTVDIKGSGAALVGPA